MPEPAPDPDYLLSVVNHLHREVAMQIAANKAKDERIAELEKNQKKPKAK